MRAAQVGKNFLKMIATAIHRGNSIAGAGCRAEVDLVVILITGLPFECPLATATRASSHCPECRGIEDIQNGVDFGPSVVID